MSNKKIFIDKLEKKHMREVILMLTSISDFKPNLKDYDSIWNKFKKQKNVHSIIAKYTNKLVGYGSIVIETKIRGGKVGHIEDIVSHVEYRKKGIGRLIIKELCFIAKKEKCYKVVLQCKEDKIPFYGKCNFEVNGNTMQKFL